MIVAAENIKINNILASSEVRITDSYPTIGWTFSPIARINADTGTINGVSYATQLAYEVKIGTSATNLGNSSFTGGVVSTGYITSLATSYRHRGPSLNRGTLYYGQVRVKDSLNNVSNWATFSFKYNSLPQILSATIMPTSPSVTTDLQLSYTFYDAEMDADSGSTIWWFKNGTRQRHLDNLSIIPSENLSYGDVWYAQIIAYDGYEYGETFNASSVEVVTSTPTASDAIILPKNPTYLDPLYAKYSFSSDSNSDKSKFRWYVNGSLVSGATTAFVRLNIEEGDEVHFEVKPDDGITEGSWVASEDVVISSPPYRVINLRIENEVEPLSVLSLSPALTWEVGGPVEPSTTLSIRIGTAPKSDNIASYELNTSVKKFTIPNELLKPGSDYFASVSVNNSEYEVVHFRTSGSRWRATVSNTTGWTIETTFRAGSEPSSTSGNMEQSYHGIRIFDGTKSAEIRLYPEKIEIISNKKISKTVDLSTNPIITITGKGSDIKVFVNFALLIDGTGYLLSTTREKYIEFGSFVGSTLGTYQNFYYTTDGNFEPTSSTQYNNFHFDTFFDSDGQIDYITASDGSMYFSVSDDNESSVVYKVADYLLPIKATAVSRDFINVRRISASSKGLDTYICHDKGTTVMHSRVISTYDVDMDFSNNDDPSSYNWELVATRGEVASFSEAGLTIDTTIRDGKYYYTHRRKGSPWFDSVSNNTGWTVDFEMTVSAMSDDLSASDTDAPQGVGIYINDGKAYETIYFFPTKIVFANSRVLIERNNLNSTDFRLTGKGGNLKLYANGEFLVQSGFNSQATDEGSGGRPALCEDSNHNLHTVWHDDGSGFRQLYYSKGTVIGNAVSWSSPEMIAKPSFGSSKPSIAIDSNGKLYIVYESEASDKSDIWMVVKNEYGLSQPFLLSSGIGDSSDPKIAIDFSDNVHVVWADGRGKVSQIYYGKRDYTTGGWEYTKITNSSYGCDKPSIDIYDSLLFVSYTQYKSNELSDIKVVSYDSVWGTPVAVSSSGRHATASDLVVDSDTVYIVWHDDKSGGNFEIFGHRFSHTLSSLESIQLITNEYESSRFPSIGLYNGVGSLSGFVYVIWEHGSDLSATSTLGVHSPVIPFLKMAYSNTINWLSSNLNSGVDTVFMTSDTRAFRRPKIQKRFFNYAHIVYEAEMVDFDDEYEPISDTFSLIRDIPYDLTPGSSYTVEDETDIQISAKLYRKEIRFGDFSDTVNSKIILGNFKYLASQDVEPFVTSLVSDLTTSIIDNDCYDAAVNINGDGWIATDEGLLFYFRENGEIARVIPTNLFGSIIPITALTFDRNGVLIVGSDNGIYVSYDHINFALLVIPINSTNCGNEVAPTTVNSLTVDTKNNLWAATNQGIIQIPLNKMTGSLSDPQSTTSITISEHSVYNSSCGLPSNNITKIVSDGNFIWAACEDGLISIRENKIFVYTQDNSALSSNKVFDIAIKNPSTRFIATGGGLLKMTSEFTFIDVLDQNTVKAVAFANPNLLWVAAGGNIYQIVLDKDDEVVDISTFAPYDYTLITPTDCDKPRVYRFDGYDNSVVIDVYINGRKVKNGYIISELEEAVVFDSPLKPTDLVEVIIRKDISNFASLSQNTAEKLAYGSLTRRIKKFLTDGNLLYAAIDGDKDQLAQYNTNDNFELPYDKIVLDTEPPSGVLTFVRQIDRRTVEMAIEDATDNISGVDSMIVSNYPNFTTDGTTPQDWVSFSETYIHDLGLSLGNTSDQLAFTTYDGRRIVLFNDVPYSGTAGPAAILKYNENNNTWTEKAILNSDDATSAVEFMIVYKNAIIIGTSSISGSGKIYVSDGITFTLLSTITGTGAMCANEMNGVLYIGTKGNGYLYAYNGKTISAIRTSHLESSPVMTFGSSIYGISSFDGKLYIGSGEQARIYKFDPITIVAQIVYITDDTSVPCVAAIKLLPPNTTASDTVDLTKLTVFGGTFSKGKIVKSLDGNPFVVSYAGLPMKVSQLKIFNNTIWASVGKTVYRYDNRWVARITHSEDVRDFIVGPDIVTQSSVSKAVPRNDITVISDNKITKINGNIKTKVVYLSLRDVAGNATREPGVDASADDSLLITEPLQIDDLTNFINVNRVLELDEYGQTVFNYDGTAPFYSADRVIEETGTYVSEIFNGGSDHVSWDIIYWDAEVPDECDLNVSVRTSDFRSTIVLKDFDTTFSKSEFEGGDISNLSGKYIQFKVTLNTTKRGKSPKLYKVVIRSHNRAAIHFFTTNFVLPSRITKGLLTAQTFLPIAADVVFGFNTNDSTDFGDYQIIEPNRIFITDPSQIGENLRIGVKLISSLPASTLTDSLLDYDPYGEIVYSNILDFNFTNISGSSKTYNFKVEFYSNYERTELETTLYSITTPTAWSVDQSEFTDGGTVLANGASVEVFAAAKGNAALRCGSIYYVSIYSDDGSGYSLYSDDHSFEIPCNPSFIDTMYFDVLNNTGITNSFHFRARLYSDVRRTELVNTYYSGLDQTGWYANSVAIPPGGVGLSNGDIAFVEFTPDPSDLDDTKVYSLIIDYIYDTDFINVSNSYTFKINYAVDFGCAEYINVPVVKDIGIMFDLSEFTDEFGKKRRTVLLNI